MDTSLPKKTERFIDDSQFVNSQVWISEWPNDGKSIIVAGGSVGIFTKKNYR